MPKNNYKKDYKNWMGVKAKIHNTDNFRKVNEGDVVWVAIGENVGVEIDGKSEKYSRPMIVLRKHSSLCFTGIPLTYNRIGKLSESDYRKVLNSYIECILGKKYALVKLGSD